MKNFFQNIKNVIDFSLRQKIRLSKKNYFVQNQPKDEPSVAENLLIEKYNLDEFRNNSTKANYFENLYTLDLLDKYLQIDSKLEIKVIDIGCKNWFYARGEYYFFKKHCEKLTLDGIELDSNRVYNDFYSRGEVAKYNIKGLEGANFIEGDFLKHEGKYDYIVWILPFVFESPLLKWGLPMKYFKPEEMLKHAFDSLNQGGRMFIINQGEEEFEAQKELCESLNITHTPVGKVESEFLEYKYGRYLTLVEKANYE